MHDSVTVTMHASPERIWALVSDVTRIGRYSPETFEAEWLDGATGPAVGARFRGHVKRNGRGPKYWTTCTVTESVTLTPTVLLRIYWTLFGWSRGKTNRRGMQRTLDAIKAEVEADAGA